MFFQVFLLVVRNWLDDAAEVMLIISFIVLLEFYFKDVRHDSRLRIVMFGEDFCTRRLLPESSSVLVAHGR